MDTPETNSPEPSAASEPTTTEGVAEATPSVFSWRVRWNVVLRKLAVIACLPTWLAFGARFSWLLDLATCFVWWYAVALGPLLVVTLLLRKWRLSLLVGVTLFVNLVQLTPYTPLAARPTVAVEGPRLRVLTQNILTANHSFQKVLDLVDAEQPDIVVLLEVDDRWTEAMAPLHDRYPYHGHRTRSDNFGLVVYSRLPTDSIEFRELTAEGTPVGIVQLAWEGSALTFFGVHTTPPPQPSEAVIRNADLAALAALAAEQPGEVVLAGDLNITPFSPYFGDLLSESHLQDSAVGRWICSTWKTKQLGWCLPIDHVLHSSGLAVVDRRIGPDVGSDHRAVVVDFVCSGD